MKLFYKVLIIAILTLIFGDLFSSFALCEDNKITSINENPEVSTEISKGSFIFGVSLFFIIVIIIAGANGADNTTISDVLQEAGVNALKSYTASIGYFEPGSPSSSDSSFDTSQIVS